jgi:hypothetical protein
MRRIIFAVAATMLVGAMAPAFANPGTATLTVLHGLPHFTADVYVNGKLTLDGFKPEASAGPLQLPGGVYKIAIRNVGADPNSTPALEGSITLRAGVNYTAIAHLTAAGDNTLSLFRNALKPVAAGKARLLLRNTAQAEPLDLRLNGKTVFSNINPSKDPARVVAPGRYQVDAVTAADSSPLVTAMPLNVRAGTETDVYVIGSSTDHSLDFMVQNFSDLSGAPSGVPSGSGGLASPPGLPAWALALMIVAALSGTHALVGRRRLAGMLGERALEG